jgi:putative hydrolase of the HAD superfamily
MPPEFLYFDLGDVLLRFSHRQAAAQMAEVAGVPAEQVWQVVFEDGLERRYELGEIDGRQFYEAFCRQTGTRPDYDALDLAGSAIFRANARMWPVIAHLEQAGHRLGILSNTSDSHWRYVTSGRYAIIPGAFERCVLSFRVHRMKPDPGIYHLAADCAGVPAERVFFTDDRPENVEGARRAGLDAELFTGVDALVDQLNARGVRSNY